MNAPLVTARARLDLFAIWEYIASDSINAADKVIADIERSFDRLATMPGMGHTRQEIDDPRYRFWLVHSYLIVYRHDTTPIQVLRIVSGYRDLAKLFE